MTIQFFQGVHQSGQRNEFGSGQVGLFVFKGLANIEQGIGSCRIFIDESLGLIGK